jgi:hypothetical protein
MIQEYIDFQGDPSRLNEGRHLIPTIYRTRIDEKGYPI